MAPRDDLAEGLRQLGRGAHPKDDALNCVYQELHRLARARLRGQASVRDPSPTSLVHETYLRLRRSAPADDENRGQFFALASVAMRSILVDNARYWQRQKRGAGEREMSTEDCRLVSRHRGEEILAIDECLHDLGASRPDLARIVECRFFAGLTVEETAEATGVSPRTVKRGWASARTWLYRRMTADESSTAFVSSRPS